METKKTATIDPSLPLPDSNALAHSQQLAAVIIETMAQAGGAIPFIDFMNRALYTPNFGYYSAGIRQFGAQGDFITAPELSPLFSHCVARQCQQLLTHLKRGIILELGAGSGIMAVEILQELQRLACLPEQYWILEVSGTLRQRQQALIQERIPDLLTRVKWLDRLPSAPLTGIILANEVMDAMPVHRFQIEENGISEFYVSYESEQFVWQLQPISDVPLRQKIEALQLPTGYISEINLRLAGWIQALAASLAKGVILLIDYGFPRDEYYHPQRHQGTLMCHYRHHAHHDPLTLVGLQDITTHVDFTAVMDAAVDVGLDIGGYTSQANFLIACGLLNLLSSPSEDTLTPHYYQSAQQIKTLVLPSEMGELFKVVALTRCVDIPLLGFAQVS